MDTGSTSLSSKSRTRQSSISAWPNNKTLIYNKCSKCAPWAWMPDTYSLTYALWYGHYWCHLQHPYSFRVIIFDYLFPHCKLIALSDPKDKYLRQPNLEILGANWYDFFNQSGWWQAFLPSRITFHLIATAYSHYYKTLTLFNFETNKMS